MGRLGRYVAAGCISGGLLGGIAMHNMPGRDYSYSFGGHFSEYDDNYKKHAPMGILIPFGAAVGVLAGLGLAEYRSNKNSRKE